MNYQITMKKSTKRHRTHSILKMILDEEIVFKCMKMDNVGEVILDWKQKCHPKMKKNVIWKNLVIMSSKLPGILFLWRQRIEDYSLRREVEEKLKLKMERLIMDHSDNKKLFLNHWKCKSRLNQVSLNNKNKMLMMMMMNLWLYMKLKWLDWWNLWTYPKIFLWNNS